ncbi:MAG: acyltransferase [Chitinophagales bacterium]|nr:acyltransferase [Chitinophagales bacterium]
MAYLSIPYGWEVLQAFFVMSGYLIIRILLYDKNKMPTYGSYYSRFIHRRGYRIFPLYIAYIVFWFSVFFIAKALNITFLKTITEEVSYNSGFLMTYTYNFSTFFNHYRGVDYLGTPLFAHLWSLSLEEQFYIIIPFLVFFLNRKTLLYVFIGAIVISPILRYVGFEYLLSLNPDIEWGATSLYHLPFFQMDCFATGGLLALTGFKRIKKPVQFTVLFLAFVVGVYVFIRWYTFKYQGSSFGEIALGTRNLIYWFVHDYQYVYILTLINFLATFIFMCFERGYGLLPRLFGNKFMAYFGKISYGLYVLHLPVLLICLLIYNAIVPKSYSISHPFLYELPAWIFYMVSLFLTGHLVFKYYESYFLRLKEKIDKKKFAKLRGEK